MYVWPQLKHLIAAFRRPLDVVSLRNNDAWTALLLTAYLLIHNAAIKTNKIRSETAYPTATPFVSPKPQPTVIRDLDLNFWINPDPEMGVSRTAVKM